ncbi:GFA family protein [Phyllobacterium sp. YR531]|uniref:GFA family protein n=1 Tax=Phyllobacterium sp. YR531 TaxID=1144343 RepID=UPI00026F9847|nr:GFA family protein [Phyllobacterium sp. YR531]EJN06104.1 hypothetical protein PMI41_00499 [Phyllobacterium sp. YR531]
MTTRIETCSCFCGDITAELRGEPFWINYDHDDDCRKAIGSPLTVWVGYRPSQMHLLSGLPKTFSRTKGVTRSFCGRCGTSIGYKDDGIADELYLTIGFFDYPERFKPTVHGYWSMRLPWVEFADGLEKADTYTRQRDPAIGTPAERISGER